MCLSNQEYGQFESEVNDIYRSDPIHALIATDAGWSPTDVMGCRALARSAMDGVVSSPPEASRSTKLLFGALGFERDHFLAHNLRCASNDPNTTTVAVVGAGHVYGIEQHFGRTTDDGMEAHSQVAKVRVGTFALAALAVPPAVSWVAYEALAESFSPLVANCGFLGLGLMIVRVAASVAIPAWSTLQRLQYETRCGIGLDTTIQATQTASVHLLEPRARGGGAADAHGDAVHMGDKCLFDDCDGIHPYFQYQDPPYPCGPTNVCGRAAAPPASDPDFDPDEPVDSDSGATSTTHLDTGRLRQDKTT